LTVPENININRLNDIVFDVNTNTIYLTDYKTMQIIKMTNDGTFSVFYTKENSNSPFQNGLYIDGRELIMQGEEGYLKSINLDTQKISIISNNLDNIKLMDGIWKYKENGYLVSDWYGQIYFINNNGISTLLLSTDPVRSADISYSSDLGLLLVPDFNNKIIAYEIK
jgi:hypothetical protein